MDLDKHRAISYCGFKRCCDLIHDLQNNAEYQKIFYPLWMGNWLTDISQATAFFSFIPSVEERSAAARYWLAFLIKLHAIFQDKWLKRYIDRKESEVKMMRHSENKNKTDYYQSRKDGAYVLPDFILHNAAFKKTWENLFASLWTEEWRSAEEAWALSRRMGEMPDSLPLDIPADENGSPAITPGNAAEIGAYYPLDHFDVADQYIVKEKEQVLDDREELELKDHEKRGFMTTTAHEALEYAKQDWLKKAFDTTQDADRATTCQKRLTDFQALKLLGHGLHTLQDFYAHSNYSELLLICMAEKNALDDYWNRRIQYLVTETEVGTFNAFVLGKDHPEDEQGTGKKTPVVTGRFDPLDTVHTLLHLTIENIHSHDNETARTEEEKKNGLYRILFGTFSDIDIVQKIKKPVEIYRDFAEHIDAVQERIGDFFMEYLVDPALKKILQEKEHLIDTYLFLKDATLNNRHVINNYRKAGELLFHQHTIEDHLRNEITAAEQQGKVILPHHALLAKDHDQTNDAVKLSYKLSCALAAEVTTEVLAKYFQGAPFSELEPLLKRRYAHPQFHVEQCTESKSLNRAIQALNGKWFWYALQNPKNKQSILGFD